MATRPFAASALPDPHPHPDPPTDTPLPPPTPLAETECIEYGGQRPHAYAHITKDYLESIRPVHHVPTTLTEKTGYYGVFILRKAFDLLTGYNPENSSTGSNESGKEARHANANAMTEHKYLQRFLFLETIAGVPGMVGGMMRHLRSLRAMKRDNGWIHTLLEEASNERLHLLTFMEMTQPGGVFRAAVIAAQGVFMTLYTLFYAISPRHCHAFVSYLEEEAVKTYTHCIDDIDRGALPAWRALEEGGTQEIPVIARKYWNLKKDASMRDLILHIRSDELNHADVNRVFSQIKASDPNPFAMPGGKGVPGTIIA